MVGSRVGEMSLSRWFSTGFFCCQNILKLFALSGLILGLTQVPSVMKVWSEEERTQGHQLIFVWNVILMFVDSKNASRFINLWANNNYTEKKKCVWIYCLVDRDSENCLKTRFIDELCTHFVIFRKKILICIDLQAISQSCFLSLELITARAPQKRTKLLPCKACQ